ncbi:hypothetical protein NF700_08005 [Sphingomonadaceae bacterium OTU29MARTA1]|uniref:hypothetical protein n=1 Tax=Sphingomonas sp. Leaf37 TaxID=2876552 RepID=UPI001E47BDB0|nr:hypothetical protein [Sphingomonas sp. Leaf37]USU10187.1 hypothetical protein NF700_08005 [Sphingomonadaceae bacterium OTU29MARTA1]
MRWLPLLLATPVGGVAAQTIPTIDTEDAGLGTLDAGGGRLHPTFGIDLRNGDFARGGYDDDAADLDRLPVHVQLGFAFDLHRSAGGDADLWLVGTSSNGVHAPVAGERRSPRAWYESNNLIGIVASPMAGLTVGTAYTIKTSPNGISGTTHEASLTAAIDGSSGWKALHPGAAATIRPKGGGGVYTQIGIAPELPLGTGDDGPTLAVPVVLGAGWGGFYEAGSGTGGFGSIGLAYSHPFTVGAMRWRLRADAVGIVRDDTLRRIGGDDAESATLVPLVTLALTTTF